MAGGPPLDERLGGLLETIAGRDPAYAAGAAVCATLSLGAALVEKAASAPQGAGPADAAACERARELRRQALALAGEDAALYGEVVAAKGDAQRMRAALSAAAAPPLAMGELGIALVELAERVLDVVPRSMEGEVRTAVQLACGAVAAAAELVAIDAGPGPDGRVEQAAGRAAEAALRARAMTDRPLRG